MTKTLYFYIPGFSAFSTIIIRNNASITINYVQLQNLARDQEIIGLEILEKFNLNIVDVEDFDPKGSQVTIAVRPDSDPESWKIVTKTSMVVNFYLNILACRGCAIARILNYFETLRMET